MESLRKYWYRWSALLMNSADRALNRLATPREQDQPAEAPPRKTWYRWSAVRRAAQASALHRLGMTLHGKGQLAEAVTAFRQARAILGGSGSPDRHPDGLGLPEGPEPALPARLETSLGCALWDQGALDDAATAFREARRLWARLVEQGHRELAGALAEAEHDLGLALWAQGQACEAAAAMERARSMLARQAAEDPRGPLLRKLATVQGDLGRALLALGYRDAAVASQRKSTGLFLRLIEQGAPLGDDLARATYDLAIALHHQGSLGEALAAYREARTVLARRVGDDCCRELAPVLAKLENDLGLALLAVGRRGEAVEAHRRARNVWLRWGASKPGYRARDPWSWRPQESHASEPTGGLAAAERRLGRTLWELGEPEEAKAAFRRARCVLLELMWRTGQDRLGALAQVENDLGQALLEEGDRAGASSAYRSALASLAQEGSPPPELLATWCEALTGAAIAARNPSGLHRSLLELVLHVRLQGTPELRPALHETIEAIARGWRFPDLAARFEHLLKDLAEA